LNIIDSSSIQDSTNQANQASAGHAAWIISHRVAHVMRLLATHHSPRLAIDNRGSARAPSTDSQFPD
jgi:hypothetical protein